MDAVKMEPFADNPESRAGGLLFLLRMQQMQSMGIQIPGPMSKRSVDTEADQPFDFSAPAKHTRLSPGSLGSDAVSDVSSHSPRSDSASPPSEHETDVTTDSSINKSDSLLTTAPKFRAKPLSALTEWQETKPAPMLSLPFPSLPVFPQTLKPGCPAPQHPFILPTTAPATDPATEMNKLFFKSQDNFAEFREQEMKKMEAGAKAKGRRLEVSTSSGTDDCNASLEAGPQHHSTPTRGRGGEGKDEAYWERRRKNNEAAKRSRDARRLKENEIAVRANFLEQENIQLKMELVQLRTELGAVRDQINRRPQ